MQLRRADRVSRRISIGPPTAPIQKGLAMVPRTVSRRLRCDIRSATRRWTPFVAALALIAAPTAFAQPGRPSRPPEPDTPFVWRDFEIMGQERVTRQQIIDAIPLTLGAEFLREEQDIWDGWAEDIRAKFGFDEVHITRLKWFPDHSVYLVVDVVEPGRPGVERFRPHPNGDATVPADVREAYKRLESLWMERRAGVRLDGDYKTFSDPELNDLAERLHALAATVREQVLTVLRESADDGARTDAAMILNWVGEPEKTIPLAIALLDDPSSDVRNNITRYALPFLRRASDPALRQSVVEALIKQIGYPSHGDRNKALSGLMMLSQADPEIRERVLREAGDSIRTIADTSVIPNVVGPARALFSGDMSQMMVGAPRRAPSDAPTPHR